MPKSAQAEEEIVGPAVITELHSHDRELTKVAGGARGWRKKTPLKAYYDNDRLDQGIYTAEQRLIAGEKYADIWDACQTAGRDSTQALSRVSGRGLGNAILARMSASEALRYIHSGLSKRDRHIVESVCGKGEDIHIVIRRISPRYKHEVAVRFCEALDALIEAL